MHELVPARSTFASGQHRGRWWTVRRVGLVVVAVTLAGMGLVTPPTASAGPNHHVGPRRARRHAEPQDHGDRGWGGRCDSARAAGHIDDGVDGCVSTTV